MSRYYRVSVAIKSRTIGVEELLKIMVERFNWEITDHSSGDDNISFFEGEGSLYGGQGEREAHEEIKLAIRKLDRNTKIKTRWTYLEEIPFEEYGDIAELEGW